MKKVLLTFLGLFFISFNSYSGEKIINENVTFKTFKCEQLKSEFIRTNFENSCLIIQKLENHYEVKSHKHSINTWNSPQLLKYIEKWDSNKNLVIVSHFNVINPLFEKSLLSISSGEIVVSDKDFNILANWKVPY